MTAFWASYLFGTQYIVHSCLRTSLGRDVVRISSLWDSATTYGRHFLMYDLYFLQPGPGACLVQAFIDTEWDRG